MKRGHRENKLPLRKPAPARLRIEFRGVENGKKQKEPCQSRELIQQSRRERKPARIGTRLSDSNRALKGPCKRCSTDRQTECKPDQDAPARPDFPDRCNNW